MENLFNFLNNFRENSTQFERDLDRQANSFLNELGQRTSQGIDIATMPYRTIGAQAGNALNNAGQAISNSFANAGKNQYVQDAGKIMNDFSNAVNSAFGIQKQPNQPNQQANNQVANTANTLASATGTNTAQQKQNTALPSATSGTYYQRDAGIDMFVSALRTAMNPLRGITGETPLDVVADMVSDTLYNSIGKKIQTPTDSNTDSNTQKNEPVATLDGSGVTMASQTNTNNGTDTSDEVIAYTYQPGDTFGEVIKKLGLATGNGLWGTNGDVNYYTQQLVDQGIWSDNIPKNIPIGTTIKLKRRKI